MGHGISWIGRAGLRTGLAALAALASVGLAGTACAGTTVTTGSGTVRTENRPVPGFDAVEFAGAGTLAIEQTGAESLEVTADEAVLPSLTSEVDGTTLTLGLREGTIPVRADRISFRVTVRELTGLTVSGAGSVTVNGVDGPELAITHGGAARVVVSGRVTRQVVDLTGVGEYDAVDLASEEADVTVSGAGSAVVDVSRSLQARVTGVGSIRYEGSPRVTQEITGLGEVTRQ
ncbi:GIN domain-containing protein [Pseudonocardia sp. RS010]|uniref:GIN domain-containing protein n=1 Tax=Pseudonocardia sp. RS010 TaxID=3385979 RepID=UPI0039A2BAD9